MYDNVRKCPNCHADAPCGGALQRCKDWKSQKSQGTVL